MKKLLLLLTIIPLLVFISSCGDDEPTGPLPTVAFDQDVSFAVVGETVTFTNNSTDGATFEWDFGDGMTSTNENTTHEYATTGEFTITLTVTGSGGRQSSMTSTILVGVRQFVGFNINSISFVNADGEVWDDDETGPDLVFAFGESSANGLNAILFPEDVTAGDLPANVSFSDINLPNPTFTSVEWTFVLLDNDDPQDDLNESEVMLGTAGDPTVGGTVNQTNGSGTFTIVDQDGEFEIVIRFQIQ